MGKITSYDDGGAPITGDYFIVARSPYALGDNFKIEWDNFVLPASNVTGLTATELLFGSSGGVITQSANLAFNSSTNTLSTTNATLSGKLVVGSSTAIQAGSALQFFNSADTYYVAFQAGTLSANTVWTLPTADSTGTQYLSSNGLGILSWGTPGGGGGVPSITGTANQVLVNGTSGTPISVAATLTLPQSIAVTSTPTFAMVGIGGAPTYPLDVIVTGANPIGGELVGIMTGQTGNASKIYSISASIQPSSSLTNAYLISNTGIIDTTNAAITTAYGNYQAPTHTGSNALTNFYNGYFAAVSGGATSNVALFGANFACGYTGVSPPNLGAIFEGNVSIGANSATSQFNVGVANAFQINGFGDVVAGAWQSTTPVGAAYGGTGIASPTIYSLLVCNGSSQMSTINLTNGQVLIGTTSNTPTASTLTQGTGITITNGPGTITIAANSSGFATVDAYTANYCGAL